MDSPCCPACYGPGVSLGTLGTLNWFRCRDCGLDFNTKAEAEGPPKKAKKASKPGKKVSP